MDFSPFCGYFLVPSECVGCPCVDVVEGSITPTTPRDATPQALLVREEAARTGPTTSAFSH